MAQRRPHSLDGLGSEAAFRGPIPRSAPLGEHLSSRIKSWIDGGEFVEGARLPSESELAERFGVSRPIIREALSRLRSEGMIFSRRGSGSYVQKRVEPDANAGGQTPFGPIGSLAQVRKCYQFRATIEGDAAFYAAQNRSAEQLAQLQEALQKLEADVLGRAVGIGSDYGFHVAVARASGNEFFEVILKQLQTPIEFTINLARSLSLTRTQEHMMTIQGEHVAIYRAIETRDGETARRVMRSHLDNACTRIFEGPARD